MRELHVDSVEELDAIPALEAGLSPVVSADKNWQKLAE
jgi:hypothetical protein